MTQLLLELGVEEFPPTFIKPAGEYIQKSFETKLNDLRLPAEKFELFYTCSRIALKMYNLPDAQPDLKEKVTGAPKQIALTPEGTLAKAGEAFLKKNNLSDYFFEEDGKKGEVIAGWKEEKGKSLLQLLPSLFDDVIGSIPFKKSMRWADKKLMFARPIRWMLLMLDDEPMEHTFHGIEFAKTSFGHRFMANSPVKVTFENYEAELKEAFVIADHDKRKALIRDDIAKLIRADEAILDIDEELLTEVANITEYPHGITASIPEKYMHLPPELIMKVLKKDQRYFTFYKKEGKTLLREFVSILNNIPSDASVVRKGNERVVASRLADAAFYYDDDKAADFAGNTEKLAEVLFQKDLGTYRDKVDRIEKIAVFLAEKYFQLEKEQMENVVTTARLIKNDLISGVVGEFPDLQGVMGRYYAANAGFNDEVALAVEEHYMPKFAEDDLPSTVSGKIVSMADKIDTIAGAFMAGLKPTGSKDKFAIRRNAISLLLIAVSLEQNFLNLNEIFVYACNLVKGHNAKLEINLEEILEFMKMRYNAVLQLETTVVQAAVETDFSIPVQVKRRAQTIVQLLKEPDMNDMVQLYKRCGNILKKSGVGQIESQVTTDETLMETEAEKQLLHSVLETKEKIKTIHANLELAREIITIKPYLDKFFDDVMVMTDDEAIKNNRLNLLAMVVFLVKTNIGDISYLNI